MRERLAGKFLSRRSSKEPGSLETLQQQQDKKNERDGAAGLNPRGGILAGMPTNVCSACIAIFTNLCQVFGISFM